MQILYFKIKMSIRIIMPIRTWTSIATSIRLQNPTSIINREILITVIRILAITIIEQIKKKKLITVSMPIITLSLLIKKIIIRNIIIARIIRRDQFLS